MRDRLSRNLTRFYNMVMGCKTLKVSALTDAGFKLKAEQQALAMRCCHVALMLVPGRESYDTRPFSLTPKPWSDSELGTPANFPKLLSGL